MFAIFVTCILTSVRPFETCWFLSKRVCLSGCPWPVCLCLFTCPFVRLPVYLWLSVRPFSTNLFALFISVFYSSLGTQTGRAAFTTANGN